MVLEVALREGLPRAQAVSVTASAFNFLRRNRSCTAAPITIIYYIKAHTT